MNALVALAALLGLSVAANLGSASPNYPVVHVAGICVGTTAQCLRGVAEDGVVAADETAQPLMLLITFDYNSARLTDAAQHELAGLAEVMKDPRLAGTGFLIEGHTDSKGQPNYNLDLSQQRAKTVTEYLAAKGVDPARLSAVGWGESHPRVSDNPQAPENRRVELRLNLR